MHTGSNRRAIDLENISTSESESESSQQSLERQEGSRPQRRAASEMSRLKTSQMYHDSAVIAEEALFAELCSKLIEDEHLATAHTAFALSAAAGFYGHEPNTYAEAVNCKDHAMWKHAMDKEMNGLDRLGVFESVPLSQVPSGTKLISNKWVYKIKPDKYKARLVIRGFMQHDPGETFAPTLKMVTLRLIFAIAAVLGFVLRQMDVCNAFVNADAPKGDPVYTPFPQGYGVNGYVLKLKKALYGLKGSPRAWYEHLKAFLLNLGFGISEMDPCLFTYFEEHTLVLIVAVYVDDLIIGGTLKFAEWFANEIKKEFLMEDLGEPKRILGIEVTQDQDCITLNQGSYVDKILKRFDFEDCTPKWTPMESKLRLTADDQNDWESVKDFPYRSLVACMLYLAVCTRFDIAYAVKELCRFLEKPGSAMVAAAKRVLRYVKATKKNGLKYPKKWRTDRIVEHCAVWSTINPIKGLSLIHI